MRSNRSNRPACIWVKYRQCKLSALIDTSSNVSIASEDMARRMGWKIHAHRTKEVSVANNDIMSVIGAAYVILNVGGQDTESEILIAPELDGLILGFDWLYSQGRIRWDFVQLKIKFGDTEWVKLHQETRHCYEVRHDEYVISIVKSYKTPEWGAMPSITEDSTSMLEEESLRNYEGKTPKMGSAVRDVSPRRHSNLGKDAGLLYPHSSVKGSLTASGSLIVRDPAQSGHKIVR